MGTRTAKATKVDMETLTVERTAQRVASPATKATALIAAAAFAASANISAEAVIDLARKFEPYLEEVETALDDAAPEEVAPVQVAPEDIAPTLDVTIDDGAPAEDEATE